MFSLQIIHTPGFDISQNTLDDILHHTSLLVPKAQIGIINIVFVNQKCIQKLNKTYRQQDVPTDVLSFHYHETYAALTDEDLAGEIVFYESRICEQGSQYGLGTEKEFYKLLIHGILHMLGYDHETDEQYEEMHALETRIWQQTFAS